MADTKTKPVNGNHVPDSKAKAVNGNVSNVPQKPKQSKLWQMLALAKDVAKDADAVQDFDRSIEERKALEKEVKDQKDQVENLRGLNKKVMSELSEHKEEATAKLSEYEAKATAKRDDMFAEFEQRFKTYESDRAKMDALEEKVKQVKEKADAAEKGKQDSQGEADKLRKLSQSTEDRARSLDMEIQKIKSDLGDDIMRDYEEEGLRQLGLDLRELSKKCHALARQYFNDLDGAKDSAGKINQLRRRFPELPLSTDATKAAAQMRCAAAEAAIAEVLSSHIFVPFYLASGPRESAASLLAMFDGDEHRRAVYRCQVFKAMRDADEVEDEIVARACGEVYTTLHPLVDASKQVDFNSAVRELFDGALRLWAEVQRSRDLITAERPDPSQVQSPGKYEEYDKAGKAGKAAAAGAVAAPSIAAVFFPQVATREYLIFNGMVLWSHQGALVAAAQEPEAAVKGPGAPNGLNGANGVSGEAPKHGVGRRQSVAAVESPFKGRQARTAS